ncbi:hypothetical protein FLGE108171_15640 [Flavobacterium gelidilacus]|uniref:hypothetical protein n=1 Tax=Flavobacterium gelidilacus TaxID=206041 RepID=UPI0003F9790E|nr:hypothetical protein [Flavobacterium gelidilacus]
MFEFRYFHGTSRIFLDSIIEFGLGGINPNFKYKNLELLSFLTKEAENSLLENKEYLHLQEAVVAMSEQRFYDFKLPNGQTFKTNYKHDGIYVGVTKGRALTYACLNRFGSEILEHCILLYKIFKAVDENFKLPTELNLFQIEKYIGMEHKPILIELRGIMDSEVEAENGENGVDKLNHLRDLMPKLNRKELDIMMSYSNFKLLNPIGKERMKFYEIEFEGTIGKDDFDFTMTEIKTSW